MTTPDHNAPEGGAAHQQPGWGAEARWTDPGWEPYSAPTPPPQQQPDHFPPPARAARLPRAITVAGTVGGAGATTLAIALGAVLAKDEQRRVLVLDAAPAGGDLGPRTFATVRPPGLSWEQWARTGCDTNSLMSQLGNSPWGVVVLAANPPAPDAGRLLGPAIDAITADGWIVVVDAGSGAVGSPTLAAAVAADSALTLAIPQRAGDANRARWFLSALALRHGTAIVRDAVVAMSDQGDGRPEVFDAVSNGLSGKVSATIAVPMDPQLAMGLPISANDISRPVMGAVSALISALTGTQAAERHPAR